MNLYIIIKRIIIPRISDNSTIKSIINILKGIGGIIIKFKLLYSIYLVN